MGLDHNWNRNINKLSILDSNPSRLYYNSHSTGLKIEMNNSQTTLSAEEDHMIKLRALDLSSHWVEILMRFVSCLPSLRRVSCCLNANQYQERKMLYLWLVVDLNPHRNSQCCFSGRDAQGDKRGRVRAWSIRPAVAACSRSAKNLSRKP